MNFINSYFFLAWVLFFVISLNFGVETLQSRGLSKRKSYYSTGGGLFLLFLISNIIFEFIFGDPKEDVVLTVLANGDIRFFVAALIGYTFVDLIGERLEGSSLSKFKAQLLALAIFMGLFIGLDTILKAVL